VGGIFLCADLIVARFVKSYQSKRMLNRKGLLLSCWRAMARAVTFIPRSAKGSGVGYSCRGISSAEIAVAFSDFGGGSGAIAVAKPICHSQFHMRTVFESSQSPTAALNERK
jgi:hypothetical protein